MCTCSFMEDKGMANGLGSRIVLTSSATEMSDYYNNPFVAFVAAFDRGPIPLWLVRKFLYPSVEGDGCGRAKYAPYGLRKVESVLLENGFSSSEVAVVHPSSLDDFVGPKTKVVGISTMDPTGMGYVSKTYSSLTGGGVSMNAEEFQALVEHPSIRKYKPKIIVGGYGSWQLQRKKLIEEYRIESVIIGGASETIADVFDRTANGETVPRVINDKNGHQNKEMPLIKHAAIHGGVEISKGCGRNCQFCTPTMQQKCDIPLDSIMKEVETTVAEGVSRITLLTEDLFLYGAKDKSFIPNREIVLKLVKGVADHLQVKTIQPSHMSLAPVVHDPVMVREVAEILIEHNWYTHGMNPIVTSETGIETGSVRLMRKYMAGKPLPFKPEQWQDVIIQAFGILNDNNWDPLATLIIGLPDEKEEDVNETLELMDRLRDSEAFYVPLFFVPLENCLLMNNRGAELDSLSKARWELLIRCWEYNVRIWQDTFLKNRISNPVLYKLIKKLIIPYAARAAAIYYRIRRGPAMQEAIMRMANAKESRKKFGGAAGI